MDARSERREDGRPSGRAIGCVRRILESLAPTINQSPPGETSAGVQPFARTVPAGVAFACSGPQVGETSALGYRDQANAWSPAFFRGRPTPDRRLCTELWTASSELRLQSLHNTAVHLTDSTFTEVERCPDLFHRQLFVVVENDDQAFVSVETLGDQPH